MFGEKFCRADQTDKRKSSEKLGTILKTLVGCSCYSCTKLSCTEALNSARLCAILLVHWKTVDSNRLEHQLPAAQSKRSPQTTCTICCNILVKHDRFSLGFACLREAVQVCKLPIFLAESWSDGSNLQAPWALCSRNQQGTHPLLSQCSHIKEIQRVRRCFSAGRFLHLICKYLQYFSFCPCSLLRRPSGP